MEISSEASIEKNENPMVFIPPAIQQWIVSWQILLGFCTQKASQKIEWHKNSKKIPVRV